MPRKNRKVSITRASKHGAGRLVVCLTMLAGLLLPLVPGVAFAAPKDEPQGSTTAQSTGVRTLDKLKDKDDPAPSIDSAPTPSIPPPGDPEQILPPGPAQPDWQPGTELVGKRTAASKAFTGRHPGEIETRLYAEPVHFKQDGSWVAVDPGLKASKDGRRKNKANNFGLELAESADDPALAELTLDSNHSVGFGLDKAAKVKGKAAKNSVTYSRVQKDTDVRLTSTKIGVKEELILASPDAPDRFVFPLKLKGLNASIDELGDVVYKDSQGNERARTPHGYMFDSNIDPLSDEPAMSTGVTYALIAHGKGTALEVTLDRDWMNQKDRIWPLTVDPEIHRGTWGDDTFVMNPYVNDYSSSTELKVGSFNGGTNKARSFMHFDTGSLPGTVTYAELQMREMHSYNCGAPPEAIFRVTQGWVGSTMRSFPGASYDPSGTLGWWVNGGCPSRLAAWNVTGMVQHFQNIGETMGSFAAVATQETNSNQWKKYRSSQAGDGPLLKVFTNYPPVTPWAVTPLNNQRVFSSNVGVSAAYADADGTPGYIAFGVWNTSNQLVWSQWSGLQSNYTVANATTSALADGWYRISTIAWDGQLFSPAWSPDQWFRVDTRRPVLTSVTPTTGATVGSPFAVSARYTEPYYYPGKVLFAVNRLDGSGETYAWSQQVASGQTATANLTISQPGQYDFYAIGNDGAEDPNAYGNAWSGPYRITVAQRPSAPTGVTGTGMVEMAKVTWTSPTADGGSPITKMRVTAIDQGGGPNPAPIECAGSCLTSNTAHFEGLLADHTYKFVVEAMNVVGGVLAPGAASSPSANAVTQSADILTPTDVQATPGDRQATVTWTAPSVGGILPLVTGYTVNTYRASDGILVGIPKTSATTAATITDLPNATPVYFKVIATTLFIVASPESAQSNTVSPLGVPFAPAKPTATIDGEQATVSWSAPAPRDGIPGDNGSAITSYTVNIYRETTQEIVRSEPVGASTMQLAVSGLMTGTPYFFTVQASNQFGISDHSPASNSGSFAGKPFEPINVEATGGLRRATVRWEPPPPREGTPGDNGSPITGYEVEVSPACSQCTGLVTGNIVTDVVGLLPATQYSFKVFSVNERGRSNASLSAQATTEIEPPGAPELISVEKGNGRATLTWEAPSVLNGSIVTGYRIKVTPQCEPTCTGHNIADPSQRSATIELLTNEVPYQVSVLATTAEGEGAESPQITVIPHKPTYVALGDSFSSGHGAPMDQDPRWDLGEECVRSSRAYAPVFAADSGAYDPEDLQFLACSGAVISQIRSQVGEIEGHPDLITLTAGGNDAGFGDVLITCFFVLGCEASYPEKAQQITNLKDELRLLYREVKGRADAAESQVFVFAYPQLFSSLDTPCGGDFAFSRDERIFIRQLVNHMNDVIREAAALENVSLIELSGPSPDGLETAQPRSFDGKEICSANDREWINGHSNEHKIRFHPNALGYQEEARLLKERWLAGLNQ